jgi:hypothetical protein
MDDVDVDMPDDVDIDDDVVLEEWINVQEYSKFRYLLPFCVSVISNKQTNKQ